MSIFSKIQKTKVPSNTFDLTHDRKLSMRMGKLVPILCMDTVPGDKISIKSNAMVRFSPLIAPVMHQVSIYMHYFFVPNRLLWKNWEKFITGGDDGFDTTVHPYITPYTSTYEPDNGPGSLMDHLGLPPYTQNKPIDPNLRVSPLPMIAYQKIWNDYYRDQNLQSPYEFELSDGFNFSAEMLEGMKIRKRAWQHDYFTSALPWAQKGPEAMLPLGNEAPIYSYENQTNEQLLRDSNSPNPLVATANRIGTGVDFDGRLKYAMDPSEFASHGYIDLNNTHYADLSTATASSINDLRRAFKLQEWLEKNARGGSRYIESIAVHFGVQSSDARLQRPEFLGGSKVPIKISEVLQMSGTGDSVDTPQGTMAGHAIGVGSNGYISKFCEEHGYIIGIMSVMPRSAYQDGIPRHFSRFDKFDFYWPEFAHIGEQEIKNKEVYFAQTDDDYNEGTFGYTPRYSEYKYINSSVHGDFRTTLDFWHMGRKFANAPALNEEFITMDSSAIDDRIFAVTNESDNLWCHVLNEVKASRKMPVFGTPKM